MDPMHAYEKLTLSAAGYALGAYLIGLHLLMLLKREQVQKLLKWFPRDPLTGQMLLAVGLGWFWLLIAPEHLGLLSSLTMDLGEFNSAKPMLRILVPVSVVLVSISVRDFLAVRALGVLGLMVSAPLLEAAFLEDPVSRLLVPAYSYVLIGASLFMVGKPYLFRDLVGWVSANPQRWNVAAVLGLAYGVATLLCAILYW